MVVLGGGLGNIPEGALVRKLVELLLELKLFIEHALSNRKICNMVFKF